MKKIILLFIWANFSFPSISQKPNKINTAKAFLADVLPLSENGELIVVNKISGFQLNVIKKYLEKDSFFNIEMDKNKQINYKDLIVLSPKEKKMIYKTIHKMTKSKWKKNYLPEVKLIDADTIKLLFKNNSKKEAWDLFNKKYGKGFFELLKPIFIRENSICFFYYGYNCGPLCGHGLLGIYKKEKNKWQLLIIIDEWIS